MRLERRDEALAALRAEGIEAQIGTSRSTCSRPYREQGEFPGAARAFEQALALPFHSQLSGDDIERVATALERYS